MLPCFRPPPPPPVAMSEYGGGGAAAETQFGIAIQHETRPPAFLARTHLGKIVAELYIFVVVLASTADCGLGTGYAQRAISYIHPSDWYALTLASTQTHLQLTLLGDRSAAF